VSVRFIGSYSASGGGSAPVYSNVVSASPGTTQNNYAPAGFSATTGILVLTAASGGTTLTGLASTGFVNGQTLQIRNASTTDPINFTNLSGSSSATNQFSNSNSGTQVIPPNSSAILTYLNSQWTFSS
jgi:hypothetical protein